MNKIRRGDDRRLSDLSEEESAKEIALKHMPDKFVWERNSKDSDYVMDWVIDAMREYKIINK